MRVRDAQRRPAGVTRTVTFLLPPKSDTDCGVMLDPVPGGTCGSLFQTSDCHEAGYFLFGIDESGYPGGGWVGPGP